MQRPLLSLLRELRITSGINIPKLLRDCRTKLTLLSLLRELRITSGINIPATRLVC
ncbi:MAG: hypothetical protein RMJ56_07480 [Gemmataceae bacterium]|nr:hypothetical protein [Gemmata sp.]MDW8197433.1 hypothetical protein [Gemmataceae bacterium]